MRRAGIRVSISLWLLWLGMATAQAAPEYHLQARKIAPDTWVIEGANADFSPANGCNIINTGFIATGAGVWVVNTGPSKLYGQAQRRLIEATVGEKIVQVVNLNLHPDYFFGNQAYADVPTAALAGTRQGMRLEGESYADNLYRLCGDWMLGTSSTPARNDIQPGVLSVGRHSLELVRLHGHTPDDLVLIDHTTGVVFAGGLAFSQRIATMPHAVIDDWFVSLETLQAKLSTLPLKVLVPSHGPVLDDAQAVSDTRDYLTWIDQSLRADARRGLDLNEVLQQPLAQRFATFGAVATEHPRNLMTLYPRYEQAELARQK